MGSTTEAFQTLAKSLDTDARATAATVPREAPVKLAPAQLAAALAKAQAGIRGASKDATNPHFHSRYATLAAVWDACRDPLTSNGLAVVQLTHIDPSGRMYLETRLMHASGEWLASEYPIVPIKNDPQGYGSALTYARRYALAAMVGVAPDDDDDGNAATAPSRERRPLPKAPASSEMTTALELIAGAPTREELYGCGPRLAQLSEQMPSVDQQRLKAAYEKRMATLGNGAAARAQIRDGLRKD